MDREPSILLFKKLLEIEYITIDGGSVKSAYKIPITKDRRICMPLSMVENNFLKSYTLERVLKFNKVCYSDLWLNNITTKDKTEMFNTFGHL